MTYFEAISQRLYTAPVTGDESCRLYNMIMHFGMHNSYKAESKEKFYSMFGAKFAHVTQDINKATDDVWKILQDHYRYQYDTENTY